MARHDPPWPTVYDADELRDGIAQLARELLGSQRDPFWDLRRTDPDPCQGDVVALPCPVPVVDEGGEPAAEEGTGFWLMLGNSCDFARPVEDVTFTQAFPLELLQGGANLRDHRSYQAYRRFYIPSWPDGVGDHIADFTRPVAIHKTAMGNAEIAARMTMRSWALLHHCLLRFFLRENGRIE